MASCSHRGRGRGAQVSQRCLCVLLSGCLVWAVWRISVTDSPYNTFARSHLVRQLRRMPKNAAPSDKPERDRITLAARAFVWRESKHGLDSRLLAPALHHSERRAAENAGPGRLTGACVSACARGSGGSEGGSNSNSNTGTQRLLVVGRMQHCYGTAERMQRMPLTQSSRRNPRGARSTCTSKQAGCSAASSYRGRFCEQACGCGAAAGAGSASQRAERTASGAHSERSARRLLGSARDGRPDSSVSAHAGTAPSASAARGGQVGVQRRKKISELRLAV